MIEHIQQAFCKLYEATDQQDMAYLYVLFEYDHQPLGGQQL